MSSRLTIDCTPVESDRYTPATELHRRHFNVPSLIHACAFPLGVLDIRSEDPVSDNHALTLRDRIIRAQTGSGFLITRSHFLPDTRISHYRLRKETEMIADGDTMLFKTKVEHELAVFYIHRIIDRSSAELVARALMCGGSVVLPSRLESLDWLAREVTDMIARRSTLDELHCCRSPNFLEICSRFLDPARPVYIVSTTHYEMHLRGYGEFGLMSELYTTLVAEMKT
jgi:hypothetical protein